ncbi:MAG: hypothetical protein EAZ85_09690 [Bacteroidetes bacterium]|nr:MAG: hypothetical protein EAZ85_09690 [Bacteroidota bacterium]TAG88145.1 MAG: hypothetical protein EAZ20_09135 [Bacteroidota bacterium]
MSEAKNMRFRSQNAIEQAVASLRSAGQSVTFTALLKNFVFFSFILSLILIVLCFLSFQKQSAHF